MGHVFYFSLRFIGILVFRTRNNFTCALGGQVYCMRKANKKFSHPCSVVYNLNHNQSLNTFEYILKLDYLMYYFSFLLC